jgi:osmotically-inducible protein OsmY
MAQPTAFPILPTSERTGEDVDAVQATTQLLAQSLEDFRLGKCVERALRGTGYMPLRGIKVTVQAQLVILGGPVPSHYLKQVAQTAALAVAGVQQVRSDLEVGAEGEATRTTSLEGG